MTEIWCLKSRKGAAEDCTDPKITTNIKSNITGMKGEEEKRIHGMGVLSERFWQFAPLLDNQIFRVNWD